LVGGRQAGWARWAARAAPSSCQKIETKRKEAAGCFEPRQKKKKKKKKIGPKGN
jgi:hypothetical protein